MKTVAVIVSAGKGKRISSRIPKQYIKIDGRPLLYYTLSVFDAFSGIDGIVLVTAHDRLDYCRRLVKQYNFKKVSRVVPGGATRAHSVYNGLNAVPPETRIVIIHDAVRPLVTQELIHKAINGSRRYGAVSTVVSPKSTIKEIARNWIGKTIPRNRLSEIQTPQAFKYSLLKDAYKKYRGSRKEATDTSFIVERAGYKVKVVDGDYRNIKITTKNDLEFVRFILQPKNIRTGIGYDIHSLAGGRQLVIGGVKIPAEAKLLGHSDADVLLHALTDAILGAVGERDIGWHFPDTDLRYRDMESKYFLLRAKELVRNRRYKILNIDSIIVAQRPRLQPYYKAMVNNISRWLKLSKDRITVKYCTPEELGPLGHKKAIAAVAVVTVGR